MARIETTHVSATKTAEIARMRRKRKKCLSLVYASRINIVATASSACRRTGLSLAGDAFDGALDDLLSGEEGETGGAATVSGAAETRLGGDTTRCGFPALLDAFFFQKTDMNFTEASGAVVLVLS
jgi:hypothetical protein